MMRRLLMLLAVFACLFGNCWQEATAAKPGHPPHIVMIVADDLGWNDIGYHGSEIKTPALDKLAAAGVRLEQHYVCPTCSPTRATLLTGRYASRFNILAPVTSREPVELPKQTVTLPRALQKSGYATHLVGKWHLGLTLEDNPQSYGFDTSYGYLHGQIDPYTHTYKEGVNSWHRNQEYLEEKGHATDLLTAEAVRLIEERGEKPFFLYVSYSVPHYPLAEAERWIAPYRKDIKDEWRRLYAASVTHMDDGIAQILAALEKSGMREETIVLFTSDNGGQKEWLRNENQYEGRYKPHTTLGDNRPLRGWKVSLYEGGIRVPAIVSAPGRLQAGTEVNGVLHAADWMPTFCKLAGVELKEDLSLDGHNVWQLLRKETSAGPRTLYWKTPSHAAVRVGDWKLIVDRTSGKRELFDIKSDPLEEKELSAAEPQRVAELAAVLQAEMSRDPE